MWKSKSCFPEVFPLITFQLPSILALLLTLLFPAFFLFILNSILDASLSETWHVQKGPQRSVWRDESWRIHFHNNCSAYRILHFLRNPSVLQSPPSGQHQSWWALHSKGTNVRQSSILVLTLTYNFLASPAKSSPSISRISWCHITRISVLLKSID